MFLIRVFSHLIYCQEKYFQTHFINKINDRKAILIILPTITVNPHPMWGIYSSKYGPSVNPRWTNSKGLPEIQEIGCGKPI
jgi:hypothetical protein